MRDLARLSKKYKIESLQKDVCVFTQNLALRKVNPTFELWRFAGRYSLIELEEYCRQDPVVFAIIKSFVSFPFKRGGFMAFAHDGIAEKTLNSLANSLLRCGTAESKCVRGAQCVLRRHVKGGGAEYEDGICPNCAETFTLSENQ